MSYDHDFAVAPDDRYGRVYLQCGIGRCTWEAEIGLDWADSTLAVLQTKAARHLATQHSDDHEGEAA